MKQLTSYNRVAGYLNKLFDLLNQRFFENELARPLKPTPTSLSGMIHGFPLSEPPMR